MGKNQKVSTQTRQNLMVAFWELYCEKRIEKITVREIAAKAGYNRSTFYEYFMDAYDVLEQIEESLLPNLEDMPPLSLDISEKSAPIDAFIKLYLKSSKYYIVLLGDKGDPAFAGKMKSGVKAKILEQLGGEAASDLEVDYALEYMLSAVIGILTYWFKNGENFPKEALLELMYKLADSDRIKQLAQKLEVK